jgi:hypothetical protein
MRHLTPVVFLGVLISVVASAQAEPPVVEIARQAADGEILGWKSHHQTPDTKTGAVWKVQPDGVLVCKGQPLGYLYTEKDCTNFVLKLEWRWPPGGKPGNGGVLVRVTEPHKIWPKSLEPQLNAGQAGDFWGLCGYRLSGPAERMKTVEHPTFGTLTNVKKVSDLEKSPGEWNSYEIVAEGETVTLTINGTQVNRATGCDVVPGKIALTAEGNEIHFRNVRLWPK